MLLGKVVGTVISTQKDQGLEGYKLLIVQTVEVPSMNISASYVVAADAIGAGMDEIVIVVSGSSARMAAQTKNKPVDAAIIAIVDSLEMDGKIIYRKFSQKAEAKR
jgi:ethanolamine utilization protein EutN